MALSAGLLIPPFIKTFRQINVSPTIAATEFVQGLDNYVRSGMNVAFGNFLAWSTPLTQIIGVFSTPSIVPQIFATKLVSAIESGLSSIYTLYQISISVPYGLMLGDVVRIVSTPQPVPEIMATDLAVAIDRECRSIVLSVSDPKLLGSPIYGPLI